MDRYLYHVPLANDAPRALLRDSLARPLRPIIASNDDWWMVMDLRHILHGVQDGDASADEETFAKRRYEWFISGYTSSCSPDFNHDIMLLHLFVTRFGVKDRSYLPVMTRGRKYAYLDAVVAGALFRIKGRAEADDPTSLSVGDVMRLTPESFNRRRSELRRHIRKKKRNVVAGHYRNHGGGGSRDAARRRRRQKAERDRWAKLGASRMPRDARIQSLETDGVGLRLCLKLTRKTKEKEEDPKQKGKRKRRGKEEQQAVNKEAPHPQPLVAALDLGRAKPYSAAISQSATKKPTSIAFKRGRYYHEMGYFARRAWERARMASQPQVRVAVEALSQTGGLKNCDPDCWNAYLGAEAHHRLVLDDEFISNDDRPRMTMRIFRSKRRSLSNAVNRLVAAAIIDHGTKKQVPKERPLVIGVGDASFACTGRGELPAPTSSLMVALSRRIKAQRAGGRQVVVLKIDESRTTMCCCACGSITTPALVTRWTMNAATMQREAEMNVRSRRLRRCTECDHAGKLRDRDVQAARNILWLTYARYYDYERPEYLKRRRVQPG